MFRQKELGLVYARTPETTTEPWNLQNEDTIVREKPPRMFLKLPLLTLNGSSKQETPSWNDSINV